MQVREASVASQHHARPTINGSRSPARAISSILLTFTALNCIFQVAWFWRYCGQNINMDGINYIGLARHLLDGDFTASLHGYWSPMYVWLIAAGSVLTHDLTFVGRVLTLTSFFLCLPLLYLLTYRLWHSRLASSLAVFWFSIARGLIVLALTTIQSDFLLVAVTLAYFIRLLACLRHGTRLNWFLLGLLHAVAFLTKAIAMPWLGISTVLAVLATHRKSRRPAIVALVLSLLAPAIVWLAWGETLKTKYGVFTTGYQLKANLMVNLKRSLTHHERGDPYQFVDTPRYDKYMVSETAWPAVRNFRILNPALLPIVLANELTNLTAAFKEFVILLTPGGILTFAAALAILARRRELYTAEFTFALISIVSLLTLVGAYGMLVFDTRYVLPITSVMIAVAAGFLVSPPSGISNDLRYSPVLRKTALALFIVSNIFLTFYWASPYRVVNRDFEVICYRAADLLHRSQPSGRTVVTIGDGPYPETGVGFEAGVYAAYLAGRQVIAMNTALPDIAEARQLSQSVLLKGADAVMVWGKPADRSYQSIVNQLRQSPAKATDQAISDPVLGEVGTILFFSH